MRATLSDLTAALGAALAPFIPADPLPVVRAAEADHTHEFLSDFRRRVLEAAKDGDLTEDVLLACMKGARGYAGGKTAAKNRAMAEVAASEIALAEYGMSFYDCERLVNAALMKQYPATTLPGNVLSAEGPWVTAMYADHAVFEHSGKLWDIPYRVEDGAVTLGEPVEVIRSYEPADGAPEPKLAEKLLSEFAWGVELGEVGKPIQIMKTGEFEHPEYGKFAITADDLAEIKANFDAKVRGQDIPIDVDHDHEAGAVGWMKSLAVKGDTLWATPEWTDRGAEDVRDGKYRYFSPHFGPWKDPESGEKHRVVLMSGAITNFPFLKNMQPISLSEFAARKEGHMAANVEELEKELTEAREKAATAQAEADERERLLSEAQEREKALAERERALTDRIAAIERDNLVKRLSERIRGSGDPNRRMVGDEDQKLAFVLRLAETFGEESDEVKHYLAEQDAFSTALKASPAFHEIGSIQGGRAGNVTGQFESKVKELMDRDPSLNRGQAAARVLSENPQLYAEYNAARS